MISCGTDKKVEVGARVGLLDVIYMEPLPAAYGVGKACNRCRVGPAALQLLLRHLQRQRSAGYVEGDLVSRLHQCQRSAGRSLRGRRVAPQFRTRCRSFGVADPHHVAYALL